MLAAGSLSPRALRRAPSTESYTSIWSGSTASGGESQDPVLGPTRDPVLQLNRAPVRT
jgi:hypothetical protein